MRAGLLSDYRVGYSVNEDGTSTELERISSLSYRSELREAGLGFCAGVAPTESVRASSEPPMSRLRACLGEWVKRGKQWKHASLAIRQQERVERFATRGRSMASDTSLNEVTEPGTLVPPQESQLSDQHFFEANEIPSPQFDDDEAIAQPFDNHELDDPFFNHGSFDSP